MIERLRRSRQKSHVVRLRTIVVVGAGFEPAPYEIRPYETHPNGSENSGAERCHR